MNRGVLGRFLAMVLASYAAGAGLEGTLAAEPVEVGSVPSKSKTLAIGVDYADLLINGYEGGYLFNEPKIRGLIRSANNAHFDEVYWRVSIIGKVTYRSKVMTVLGGANLSNPGWSPIGVIMKQCDPLAVAIDEAHKQGLRIFVYITLFDFAYPGL